MARAGVSAEVDLTAPQSFDMSGISSTPSQSVSGIVTDNSQTYGFDPSGTYFFWAEYSSENIRRLVASTPFDISTLSADQSIARSFGSSQFGVELSRDGTKIFSYGYDNSNHIYSSTLSTPWDLTTVGSWVGSGSTLLAQNNNYIRFSFDGTKLYTAGYSTCSGIRQYALSTPWDVSTATYDTGIATSNNTTSLFLSGDGTDMVFYNNGTNRFEVVDMSTPWDLSTASTPTGVLSVAYGRGAYIDPNATIFVTYQNANGTLYEFTL